MATLPIALIQTRTPASPAAALAHVAPLVRGPLLELLGGKDE